MAVHECTFGPVERAHFTGNPHRKCLFPGCRVLSLDLYEAPCWISEPHCRACGSTEYLDTLGQYSGCCNKLVVNQDECPMYHGAV